VGLSPAAYSLPTSQRPTSQPGLRLSELSAIEHVENQVQRLVERLV
jgi:hypothetical protein